MSSDINSVFRAQSLIEFSNKFGEQISQISLVNNTFEIIPKTQDCVSVFPKSFNEIEVVVITLKYVKEKLKAYLKKNISGSCAVGIGSNNTLKVIVTSPEQIDTIPDEFMGYVINISSDRDSKSSVDE